MRKERRWLKSVAKEAAKAKIEMPWARGPRRLAMIAKREAVPARISRLRA